MARNPYPPAKGTWRKLRLGERRVTRSGQPIAPNYTNVYINTDRKIPIEAVGKDSKGRTIYIRTKKHELKSSSQKFKRVDKWEAAYPAIMARVKKHFPRREEAKVLYLIDKTMFRIGGETDTKASVKAYGATTLMPEHVRIEDKLVKFNFVGKKGKLLTKVVEDPLLAQLIQSRLKNKKLFRTDEGRVLSYLRSLPRAKTFKTSDFRPFYGTRMAKQMIASIPVPKTRKEFRQSQRKVAVAVSEELGNTPAVALKSYIDPKVWLPWEAELPVIVKIPKWKAKRIKKK